MEFNQVFKGKIFINSSPIHGTGVFASEFIAKGEVVIKWEDTREISSDDFEMLSESEKHYIDIQNGTIFLVGKPERYVNHSCDANTTPGDLCDIAARDIHPNEEITADYSNFFIPSGHFQCSCGKRACRGLVYGLNNK